MTALWYALAVFAGILIGAFFTWVGWCRHTTRWQIAAQLLAVFCSQLSRPWGCMMSTAHCTTICFMRDKCGDNAEGFSSEELLEGALDAAERQVGP